MYINVTECFPNSPDTLESGAFNYRFLNKKIYCLWASISLFKPNFFEVLPIAWIFKDMKIMACT